MDDISRLINNLNSSQVGVRAEAAEQLAQQGDAAAPAVIGLLRNVGDSDETVREWSVAALEGLGTPSVDDLDALIDQIDAEQPDVGYWAATLLGRLEADAAPAVDALARAAAGHPESQVRQRAVWALGKIGPAAGNAVPVLKQAAQSSEPRLARLAEQALTQIGP